MKKPPTLQLTDAQMKVAAELGRIGGLTRAKRLSAEERRAIAVKASKAAAKARTRKAKSGKMQSARP